MAHGLHAVGVSFLSLSARYGSEEAVGEDCHESLIIHLWWTASAPSISARASAC